MCTSRESPTPDIILVDGPRGSGENAGQTDPRREACDANQGALSSSVPNKLGRQRQTAATLGSTGTASLGQTKPAAGRKPGKMICADLTASGEQE